MFRKTLSYQVSSDPTVQPVIIPPRRIPFGLEDRVKTALLDMCSQGIVVPVDQPRDWVNAMVVVKRKIRKSCESA